MSSPLNEKPTTARATIPRTMGAFQQKWSNAQRDAMVSARLDRGMTYRRVCEVAAAGQLTASDGSKLAPFSPPLSTVASLARDAKKRRMGKDVSQLAQLEPRDAIEALRRRLVNAADAMLTHELKRPVKDQDPERMRQIGRCVREFAAIPGVKEQPRPAPGAKENGQRDGGETRSGLAGELIAAHRKAEGSTAPETPSQQQGDTENTGATERSAVDAEEEDTTEDNAPGSLARGLAARALVPSA